MSIYTRDNINYGGMLGNAMAAKAGYLRDRYNRVAQQGQIWGNAVQNTGSTIQNAFNQAAQYQYNKDQLANQQQFQAEQAALNRAQQLNMAREQQKFQEHQNALNRQNTYDIALLNKETAQEDKVAQNVMYYNNAAAVYNELETEFNNTDPNTSEGILKRAKLQSQMEQERNKMNYYGAKLPPQLIQETQKTPVITGEDAEKALAMFDTAEPKKAYEVKQDDDTFEALMKAPWTDANKAKAVELANNDPVKLQVIANKGLTKEEATANAKAKLDKADKAFQGMNIMAQDTYLEQHPEYIVVNGHLAYKR